VTPTSPSPTPSAAPAPPPSAGFPPLKLGMWQGKASGTIVDRNSGRAESYACPLLGSMTGQTGGEFSGGVGASGSDPGSDRRCGYQGNFTGVMSADGTVTSLRFETPFRFGGCTQMEGGDTFTGKVSSDGSSLTATGSGHWICQRDFTIPAAGSVEGDMTTTLSIQKQ